MLVEGVGSSGIQIQAVHSSSEHASTELPANDLQV